MPKRTNHGPRAWFAATLAVAALLGCGGDTNRHYMLEYYAETPSQLSEKAPESYTTQKLTCSGFDVTSDRLTSTGRTRRQTVEQNF